jgi:pyruvate dehydrogenase E1 component
VIDNDSLEAIMTQLLDDDPVETREWLDSLQAVLRHQGGKRATYLMDELTDEARRAGLAIALDLHTPYVNTIPLQREANPIGIAKSNTAFAPSFAGIPSRRAFNGRDTRL